jgi:hypothetical protein
MMPLMPPHPAQKDKIRDRERPRKNKHGLTNAGPSRRTSVLSRP